MRVLILHNRYRAAGGEERAVVDLAAMLTRHGHTVRTLQRSSDATHRGRAARGMLTGGLDPSAVGDAVTAMSADVVHAHNLHPTLGWRALAAARAAGARTVLHLHNYRLYCAIGIAFRDGADCRECRGGHTAPGLRHRCRGPRSEAAIYALGLHRQLAPLLEHADALVAVSAAQARTLEAFGLPPSRATALLNFLPDAAFAAAPARPAGASSAEPAAYALVSGRLVPEKGFDTAIAAARAAGVPLVVAGDGPDAARLRALASGADVRFTGRLEPDALADLRRAASVVLVPSRWEEPCPYSVSEAMADGVPVLASARGGLPEMVGAAMTLPEGDTAAWAHAIRDLLTNPETRAAAGRSARRRARETFDEARYHERLIAEVYAER